MYIIHENLPSSDPRLSPLLEYIGNYWHFTIVKVPEGASVYLDWLEYEKITEDVAYAHKLTGAYKNTISISEPVKNSKDINQSSDDVEWKKYVYKLNKRDQANVVILMKTAMKLFIRNHLLDKKQIKKLLDIVNTATTIEECEIIMHHYFNVNSATTNNMPREPKFKVDWPAEYACKN